MQILTNGVMRAQAAGLNMNDRVAVATFVTGKAPTGDLGKVPETNLCTDHSVATAANSDSDWNGWGRDLNNSRYQPNPGITVAEVPHLKVKWAFGYRASYIYGQPTIVGGQVVYVTAFPPGAFILSMQRPAAPTGHSMPRHRCAPPCPWS